MRARWVCQIAVSYMTLILPFVIVGQAKGDVILESAILGTTGQNGGAIVYTQQYVGARFHVEDTVVVDHIGGHLLGDPPPASATLFGAIYPLSGPTAFPADNLTPLAMTTLSPPFPSEDILVPLSVTLNPGDYALVFGSGLFGADGAGSMATSADQFTTSQASFIFFTPASGWRESGGSPPPAPGYRFVITGVVLSDECTNPDLSATVVIDSCNSKVPNILFPSGCTISDLIGACAEGASNHGQFVSCVSHLTNNLKKAGTITGQQKGAIQSCAAQANIP